MDKMELVKGVQGYFNKTGFQLRKYSPEIFIAAGVIGTVVSTIMACKATTRVSAILEDAKEEIDTIHATAENESMVEKYSKEDSAHDLLIVYVQTGVKLAKLYAPAIALGALSIAGIVTSNNILRKRNIALAAAYASIDKGFKEYRSRVVERFGQEADRELRYNIKATKIEESVVDEDGKEKKVKKTIGVIDTNTLGEYSFLYSELNPNWRKNGNYNRMFLLAQQQLANDRLRADGYLFLNDVLDSLGIKKTKAGQIVGWRHTPESPNSDGFVDFGIHEAYRRDEQSFVTDKILGERLSDDEVYERCVMLEFNVDGNIWESMKS